MNVLDLASRRVRLKKVSGTKGGEWQGPCPGCGGEDRFHVWPHENDGKGSYWCRGCGHAGDNIQFLRDFDGLSFKEACVQLDLDMPNHPGKTNVKHQARVEFIPDEHPAPADLWQEKAERFVTWSQAELIRNEEALLWLSERGIDADTALIFRLGWNPGEDGKDIYRARKAWGLEEVLKEDGKPKALWIPRGLVIPCIIHGVILRVRIRRPEGEPRYYVLPGSSMNTMIIEPARRAFVVVESELDAIAAAASQEMAGTVALGSVAAKPDRDAYAALQNALQILLALDYDAAGAKAMSWWMEQFPRCERWPVPQGKDPGEARRMGMDLAQWIKAGLPPALTIADPGTLRRPNTIIRRPEPDIRQPSAPPLTLPDDIPEAVRELYGLLRKNPSVKIINTRDRYTVLRNGKYVGGRINELVFRSPAVLDYIERHPAEEIDGENLIMETAK